MTVAKVIEKSRSGGKSSAPSLRPPTLMIDLLFGALMLFAFQMGDPSSQNAVPHDIELPTDDSRNTSKKTEVIALVPVKLSASAWAYETNDGRRLSATEVVKLAKPGSRAPVLVLSESVSVQQYLDAETPLRTLGLRVGLAVTPDKGRK